MTKTKFREFNDINLSRGTLDTIIQAVLLGYNMVDTLIADAANMLSQAQNYNIPCRKGCGGCCYQHILGEGRETITAAFWIKAQGKEFRHHIRANLRKFKHKTKSLYDKADYTNLTVLAEDYWDIGIPCAFLSEKQECLIYPVRPFACRDFLVISQNGQQCDYIKARAKGTFSSSMQQLNVPFVKDIQWATYQWLSSYLQSPIEILPFVAQVKENLVTINRYQLSKTTREELLHDNP